MLERCFGHLLTGIGVALCLFTLGQVNYNWLQPQSALAIFVGAGLVACFSIYPAHARLKNSRVARSIDLLLMVASAVVCGYVVVQTEPAFQAYWSDGMKLGDRAGVETMLDFRIGFVGLLLVLEATRRSIGWIVPILALLFVAHSFYCHGSYTGDWWPIPSWMLPPRSWLVPLPDWMLPHAGQSTKDIVSTTFLQSLGVFGPAASVMFRYVFLFLVFGAFLEMSGAIQFIIDLSQRVFRNSTGGPAKMAVLASGLMGSLSGSAVANAVTTGSFTIPMMIRSGFKRHDAAAVEAAAGSGGAMVPPVMGAAAYLILELVDSVNEFSVIMRAAILPALLYYFSLLVIVHLYALRHRGDAQPREEETKTARPGWFEGVVFFSALAVLVVLLLARLSPFKAVTIAVAIVLLLSAFRRELALGRWTRWLAVGGFVVGAVVHQIYLITATKYLDGDTSIRSITIKVANSLLVGMFVMLAVGFCSRQWRPKLLTAMTTAMRNGASLIVAAACVGIIIGVVQQTGIAQDFAAIIKSWVQYSLFAALLGVMVCSLVLGMGVPPVVCYLLMATLMGTMLNDLGVNVLAAHLFIFYFAMMSMVTPPVALAAYAASSIAQTSALRTSFSAFRFALVGFTLPFLFVYRPVLLLQRADGLTIGVGEVPELLLAVYTAVAGIVSLAAFVIGQFFAPVRWYWRLAFLVAAMMLLAPGKADSMAVLTVNSLGFALFVAIAIVNRIKYHSQNAAAAAS